MNKTKNTIFSAVTYFFYNFQLSNFFLRNLQQSPKKPSPPKKTTSSTAPMFGSSSNSAVLLESPKRRIHWRWHQECWLDIQASSSILYSNHPFPGVILVSGRVNVSEWFPTIKFFFSNQSFTIKRHG